nr:integrase, catalytic region, zinc finger, CCHC-type, peptidase aspartic, catalytic [Tanacetum cinerariifolium]
GLVYFGNDHFATITGYRDYVQGDLTICHVYYVKGVGYNLSLVGKICDGDLDVAFCSNTCYVWNFEGDDLLTGACESNLYTISISDLAASSPNFFGPKPLLLLALLRIALLHTLGFRIYNRQTKKITKTIHVKFDELTAMASECNNSGPSLNYSNFQDSSEELNEIPSQQDLDNFFGPFFEEHFTLSTYKVSDNSAANTLDVKDTLSPSSIIVKVRDALQIVTSLEEPQHKIINSSLGNSF